MKTLGNANLQCFLGASFPYLHGGDAFVFLSTDWEGLKNEQED